MIIHNNTIEQKEVHGTVDSEDDAEEDDEDVNEVDGADMNRLKKAARIEYEESDNDMEVEKEEEKEESEKEEEMEIESKSTPIVSSSQEKVPEGYTVLEAPFKVMKLKYFRRVMVDKENNKVRVEFEFPPNLPKLLLVELAEKAANTTLVNSIQHINRCIVAIVT